MAFYPGTLLNSLTNSNSLSVDSFAFFFFLTSTVMSFDSGRDGLEVDYFIQSVSELTRSLISIFVRAGLFPLSLILKWRLSGVLTKPGVFHRASPPKPQLYLPNSKTLQC